MSKSLTPAQQKALELVPMDGQQHYTAPLGIRSGTAEALTRLGYFQNVGGYSAIVVRLK